MLRSNRRSIATQLILAALFVSGLLLLPSAAMAQSNPLYWNTTSGTGVFWDSAANWWTGPTGGPSTSAPDITFDAVFNGSSVNGPTTVQLEAPAAAFGLYFNNTGTTLLDSSSATSESLSIGSHGITINAGAGAVTLGDPTDLMPLNLMASQTWTNNAATALTVVNNVGLDASITTASTLTLTSNSGAINVISGAISNGGGIGASLGLNATQGNWVLSGANSFSGAVGISGGVLDINSTAALPATSSVVQTGTGQLMFQLPAGTPTNYVSYTISNALTLSGSHGVSNFGPAFQGGALWLNTNFAAYTLSGPITIAGGTSTEISMYSAGNTLTFTGGIGDGGGNGNLVLAGGGAATTHNHVFILAAANNTYGGSTLLLGQAANTTIQLGVPNALPTTTALTLQGDFFGGTGLKGWLDLNGNNQQLAGLMAPSSSLSGGGNAGDNRVVNTGSGTPTLTLNDSGTDLFTGTLGGGTLANPSNNSFNLVMSGTGTIKITGDNTYSGTTVINSGTLQIGNGGATGSLGGTSSISNSGVLAFNTSTTNTVSAPISGNGSLQQNGTGTTNLNGSISYSGPTTVNGGVLQWNNYNSNAAAGSVTINSSGTFAAGAGFFANDPNPSSSTPLNSYVMPLIAPASTGTIALTADSSENLNFSNAGTNPFNVNLSLGAVGSANYTGTLTPFGTAWRLGGGGGTLTYSAALNDVAAGSTSLVISPGTVVLTSPTNTYSGTTTINAGGTLRLGAHVGPSTATFTSDANSGIGAAGTSNYTEALAINGGAMTINGVNFTAANNIGGAGNLGSNWSFSPHINNPFGGPAGNFVGGYQLASNQGTYNLLNSFYYEGNATPITLSVTGLTPGDLYDARVYYRTWSNLDNRIADFTFNGGFASQNLTVNEDANTAGNYIDYQYVVGPSGTLTVSETNDAQMIAGGSWHWYGFTNQDLGVAPPVTSNVLPTTTALSMAAGSTLDLNGASQSVQSLSGAGGTITNFGVLPATLTLTPASGSSTFSGSIQDGTARVGLTINGAGTEILTGTNTYSGATTITGGVLQIGNGGTTGTLGTANSVTNNGTLVFNRSNNYSPAVTINGNGSVRTNGTGGLALLGANNYSNGTTVNGGVLSLGVSNTPAGSGPITLNGGRLSLVGQQSSGITAQGLQLQLYAEASSPPALSNYATLSTMTSYFAGLTPSVTTQTTAGGLTTLTWPFNGGGNLFNAQGFSNSTNYEAQLTGNLYIAQPGSYTFQTSSDDGAALFIDGSSSSTPLVTSNVNTVNSSAVFLSAGLHTVNIGFNQGGGGADLGVSYSGPDTGGALTAISNDVLVTGGGAVNATQTYANNLAITANSTIDVTGSLAAKVGDLSINGSTLRITSDDTSGNAYSVTFAGNAGATTLSGSPTFNINSSAGGGPATLTLGALHDGGTLRTISFNGTGTINLSGAGTSLVSGTQINIIGQVASSGPATGLVSNYQFEEGSGTTALDSGTNRVTGTLVGPGVGYTTAAKTGLYALNLTAANSYVSIPHSSLNQLSSYTVSAWFNASSLTNGYGGPTIFSTRNGGDTTFDLQVSSAGLHGDVGNGSGTWLTTAADLNTPIGTGNWYLVTYSVSPSGTTVYLNGGALAGGSQAAISYTNGGTPMLENGGTFATIGNQSPINPATQFFGSIDDVRIYNSALTAAQVDQLYTLIPTGVTVNSNTSTSIGTGSQLSVGAGSTFNLGASQQVQTLSGAGTISLNSNTLTVGTGNADATNSTFSGTLRGSGGGLTLNKAPSGILTLLSSATYTGPTTIAGGTLQLGATQSGVLNIPSTHTFTSDATSGIGALGTGNYTEALAFAQGGSLSINGVTFANANNSGGAGNLGSNWSFTSPVNNSFNNAGQFVGGFQPSSGGTTSLLNSFVYEGTSTPVTLTLTGLVAGSVYDARVYYRTWSGVDERTVDFTFNNGNTSQGLEVNEDANSTANYIDYEYQVGASGTLTVSETNAAFPLMQNGGSWHWYGFSNQLISPPPSTNILPTTTALSLASGGTLDLQGDNQTVASLAGAGGVVTNLGVFPATLTLAPASGSTTFSGAIQDGNSPVALALNGAGTQVLAGSNTYSGGTTVTNGTLRVANTTGSATGTGPVTIGSGATLAGSQTAGQGSIAGLVTLAGNASVLAYNGATLTFNGGLTIQSNASGTFNLSGVPNGISGSNPLISLNGPLTANGNLTVNLSGTPTTGNYDLVNTSGITAESGTGAFVLGTAPSGAGYLFSQTQTQVDLLVVGSITWTGAVSNSWDTSANSTNWAGGSPVAASQYLDGATVTFADQSPLTSSNVPNTSGIATVSITSAGLSPFSVTFTNAGAANHGVDYVVNNASGTAGITGTTGITLQGTGNVTLQSANMFSGPVNVNAGQLILQNGAAIGNSSGVTVVGGAALQLQSGSGNTVSYGTTVGGSTRILTSLAGTGVSGAGALVSSSGINTYTGTISLAGAATIGSTSTINGDGLTLSGGINNNGNLLTFAGAGSLRVNSNPISGLGGLTQSGPGTLTLAATNLYSGATSVNGGTLRVTGSLASGSAVTVGGTSASGTPTLAGGGTVNGSVTVVGTGVGNVVGHLAPSGFTGSSTSTLTINGNLTLNNGSVLDFNMNNMSSDLVLAISGLTLGDVGTLNINSGELMPGSYELIGGFTSLTNTDLNGWTVGSHTGDTGHVYSFLITGNQFDLVVGAGFGSATWSSTGNEMYSKAANWTPVSGTDQVIPNGPGQSATFGANGSETNVTVDGAYTIGTLAFTSNSGFTLSSTLSSQKLTMNNNGSGAQVTVAAGSVDTLQTSLVLSEATTFTIAPMSVLTVASYTPASPTIAAISGAGGLTLGGGGTLELSSPNTYAGATTVNSGTLLVDGHGTLANTPSVTVAPTATLQLIGTGTPQLTSTTTVNNHGSAAATPAGGFIVSGSNQVAGVVTGTGTPNVSDGTVTYDGDTVVGDGTATDLTVTQILQNTLTINANATVTIAPSGPGFSSGVVTASASNATAAVAGSSTPSTDDSGDSTGDALSAIQAAIASGSISSVRGQQLENRIAAIERLAATDPGLDVSLLDSRVLASLPSTSVWSATGSPVTISSGSGLLALDSSTFSSGSSSGSAAFAPTAGFAGSPAAVPEPSSLLLAFLGGIGLVLVVRRRTIGLRRMS